MSKKSKRKNEKLIDKIVPRKKLGRGDKFLDFLRPNRRTRRDQERMLKILEELASEMVFLHGKINEHEQALVPQRQPLAQTLGMLLPKSEAPDDEDAPEPELVLPPPPKVTGRKRKRSTESSTLRPARVVDKGDEVVYTAGAGVADDDNPSSSSYRTDDIRVIPAAPTGAQHYYTDEN